MTITMPDGQVVELDDETIGNARRVASKLPDIDIVAISAFCWIQRASRIITELKTLCHEQLSAKNRDDIDEFLAEMPV